MANTEKLNGHIKTRHKRFFCQCLAEFMPPQELAAVTLEKFAEDFREKIAEIGTEGFLKWVYYRIEYYAYHPDAKKWQDLTRTMRAKWLADIESISLANRKVRIAELKKLYQLVMTRLQAGKEAGGAVDPFGMAKLTKEASALLDQIQDETGQKITRSKSEVTGEDGAPLIPGAMNVILQLPDFQKEAQEAGNSEVNLEERGSATR